MPPNRFFAKKFCGNIAQIVKYIFMALAYVNLVYVSCSSLVINYKLVYNIDSLQMPNITLSIMLVTLIKSSFF